MNAVFILSDRHNPEYTGCYGNPITRTPHIDSPYGSASIPDGLRDNGNGINRSCPR